MKLPDQTSHAKSRRRFLAVPLFALLLALGVSTLFERLQRRHMSRGRPNDIAAVKTDPDPQVVARRRAERLSESLLTDSILSIVQSYYVDQARVDNHNLVLTALASLAANPRVKTGHEAPAAPPAAASSVVWIEIDGERRELRLPAAPRYQDMLDLFADVASMLDEKGIDIAAGEAPEKGAQGAVVLLNSMLAQLDAHSALLSPEAYKELRQGTEGSFGGLGVLVGIRDNLLTVIKPLPRSPAQRAGIKKHDRILGIDGVFTYGYTLDELVEHMRGDPGTDVQISLLRDGAPSPSEMVLKREVIQVDSVTTQDIKTKEHPNLKVLHVAIESFSSRTSREVLGAIKKARQRFGGVLHGLVLDLRSNPGGLLDQAVQVADLFLQSGVIVTTKGRREEVESAGSGIDEGPYPMVVLIDGDSASASEIVAGALQDHGRALVIGQPSFGKGSVQTIFELPGERALKLTIARYYTPAGRSIQNVGITPDVWLQPVSKLDGNDNLFGPYRYKNERFLRNHLENLVGAEAGNARTPGPGLVPARRAYYLANPPTEDARDAGEREGQDREMELALQVMGKIQRTYGDRLPAGTARASHWLGLAGPEIAAYADRLDQDTRTWLARKHGVDWAKPDPRDASPALSVTLEGGETAVQALPGDQLEVKWRVANDEPRRVERVSVFVRSDAPGFDTREVILGGIDAKSARTGVTVVPIPSFQDAGPLLLRVGVAVDAWPAASATAERLVEIQERPIAELAAEAELVEEGAGGAIQGVLERDERARLRVSLRNFGKATAREATLRVINLAGEQVSVDGAKAPAFDIAPGDAHEVMVTLVGGKKIAAPELGLGLYVESGDMRQPLRKRVAIKALPTQPPASISNLSGH